jgi:hypothetical protein
LSYVNEKAEPEEPLQVVTQSRVSPALSVESNSSFSSVGMQNERRIKHASVEQQNKPLRRQKQPQVESLNSIIKLIAVIFLPCSLLESLNNNKQHRVPLLEAKATSSCVQHHRFAMMNNGLLATVQNCVIMHVFCLLLLASWLFFPSPFRLLIFLFRLGQSLRKNLLLT